MRAEFICHRHKIIFRFGLYHYMLAANEMRVVIIIPARNRINDLIALVAYCAEYSINERSASRSYQYFAGAVVQPFHVLGKRKDCFAKVEVAFGSRLISKMFPICLYNGIFQFFGYGKYSGIEVANSKVINVLTLPDLFSYFTSQLYNFRSYQGFR